MDWYDGGKFLEAHSHTIAPGNDLVGSSWNEVTRNISRTLSAIEVLRPLAEAGDAEAEGAPGATGAIGIAKKAKINPIIKIFIFYNVIIFDMFFCK